MNIKYEAIVDAKKLMELHKHASKSSTGVLAISDDECKLSYFEQVLEKSNETGISIGAYHNDNLIGFLFSYKSGLRVFDHVLATLTMAVHPDYQGKGIGKELFTRFMQEVNSREDIKRVELFTVASNERSIGLYKSFGYEIEGVFKKRALLNGELVDDFAMAWVKNRL